MKRGIKVADVGAINQDYAWGQDSWKDFKGSLAQLEPEAKTKVELWPKFGAGQYGTEISTLLQESPALVYSSLWGGDLQAFVLQAAPRGLMKDRIVVLSASDHVLPPLGNKMPDGVIIGARGSNGQFAEKSPINDWYVAALAAAHPGLIPVQPHYRAAQGLLGLKTAVEKRWRPTAARNRPARNWQTPWSASNGTRRPVTSSSRSATAIKPFNRTLQDDRSGILTPRWCGSSTSSALPPNV